MRRKRPCTQTKLNFIATLRCITSKRGSGVMLGWSAWRLTTSAKLYAAVRYLRKLLRLTSILSMFALMAGRDKLAAAAAARVAAPVRLLRCGENFRAGGSTSSRADALSDRHIAGDRGGPAGDLNTITVKPIFLRFFAYFLDRHKSKKGS